LAENGYEVAGRWDLGQVCGHLANWLTYPIDGYPPAPLPIRWLLAVMRATMGKRQLQKILDEGFRDGSPTMPASVPKPHRPGEKAREQEAVERLCSAVRRMQDHKGAFVPSPLFGSLDRDTQLRLQLRHCNHHLRFLIPRAS
jgi:hypothetical protein